MAQLDGKLSKIGYLSSKEKSTRDVSDVPAHTSKEKRMKKKDKERRRNPRHLHWRGNEEALSRESGRPDTYISAR